MAYCVTFITYPMQYCSVAVANGAKCAAGNIISINQSIPNFSLASTPSACALIVTTGSEYQALVGKNTLQDSNITAVNSNVNNLQTQVNSVQVVANTANSNATSANSNAINALTVANTSNTTANQALTLAQAGGSGGFSSAPYNYAQASAAWVFGITVVVFCWLVSKNVGVILDAIKRF